MLSYLHPPPQDGGVFLVPLLDLRAVSFVFLPGHRQSREVWTRAHYAAAPPRARSRILRRTHPLV